MWRLMCKHVMQSHYSNTTVFQLEKLYLMQLTLTFFSFRHIYLCLKTKTEEKETSPDPCLKIILHQYLHVIHSLAYLGIPTLEMIEC